MSLKNLIALQKQKESKGASKPVTDSAVSAGNESSAAEQAVVVDDGARATPVEAAEIPAQEAGVPAPGKPKGLGLNLAGAGRAVGAAIRPATQRNISQPRAGSGVADTDSAKDDGAVFGLADLAAFNADDESAPAKSPSQLDSGFLDEIEATAPDRELPPELTKQQSDFVESLDGIYSVLTDPDLFGQQVRTIMLELQENPEYIKLVQDQDVSTMIRGMRNTMGLARIKKQEKSRKSGTSTRKSARGKSAVSDEDMALLDSLMGGLGDD
jgi:hypothetical protein